ncbi:MAG: sodium:proton antiporter, partial [Phycisphaerales bacterium]|nr:sodium:proton antiporter [Phycisphaerales bacterium]
MSDKTHETHAADRLAPWRWLAALLLSTALGAGLGLAAGAGHGAGGDAADPRIAVWACAPFILLLLMIAVMPFVGPRFWHRHYPEVALTLGGGVLGYFLTGLGHFGTHAAVHAGKEYFSFIALVGGLYVVSGGILVDIRERGTPLRNTLLLAGGALLANLVGTTGASVLLIRPFMRMNRGRLRPLHVVFFIFIVSNCGGSLTPIGDPPLYLGYLTGVPFFWTLTHLWPSWALVIGTLLAIYFVYDRTVPLAHDEPGHHLGDRREIIVGRRSVVLLLLLVSAAFFDPLVGKPMGLGDWPIGAAIQLGIALLALFTTPKSIHHANGFTLEPVKEVGLLFVGIFLTMMPALAFLRQAAPSLGLSTPTHYYFASGSLSAFLDNAPTYLSLLQVQLGVLGHPLGPEGIQALLASKGADVEGWHTDGVHLLIAISLGSVFFGAMTYIGNGPNFMVRSIAESSEHGVKMPSFFAY